MNVNINLENLKLKNVEYDDDVLRYNGYRLELWNSTNIISLTNSFNIAQEFFFQSEMEISKTEVKDANLDEEEVVFELINLLYDNVQKAVAVQQHTLAPFNEIKEETVTYNDPITYVYNDDKVVAYYEEEVIRDAKEFRSNYVNDMNLSELVDKYILDYLEFIDIKKLATILRDITSNESDEIDLSNESDDKKVIELYNGTFEDLVEQIEDNDLFDYDKYIDSEVTNINEAIEEIQPYIGDSVFDKEIYVDGWKSKRVILFERF